MSVCWPGREGLNWKAAPGHCLFGQSTTIMPSAFNQGNKAMTYNISDTFYKRSNRLATCLYYHAIWLTKAIREYISGNCHKRSKNKWLWLQKDCLATSVLSSTKPASLPRQQGNKATTWTLCRSGYFPVLFRKIQQKIVGDKIVTNIYMTPNSY